MSAQAEAGLNFETLAQAEQHIFGVVVRGLSAQGWKQARSENTKIADCVWLAADGCKCAIGHILVDPPSYDVMSNQSISSALEYMPPELKKLRQSLDSAGHSYYLNFLQSLLMLHDSNPTPDSMQLAFQYLGKHRGLRWPEDVALTT